MQHPRFNPAPLVWSLATVFATLLCSPVHAQAVPATATLAVTLPAQPLGTALNELARQGRFQLIAHPDQVAGKTAPTVAGTLTAWLAGRAAAGRDAVMAVKEDW